MNVFAISQAMGFPTSQYEDSNYHIVIQIVSVAKKS